MACLWRSQDNVSFNLHVGSWIKLRSPRFYGKCLHLLRHLNGPLTRAASFSLSANLAVCQPCLSFLFMCVHICVCKHRGVCVEVRGQHHEFHLSPCLRQDLCYFSTAYTRKGGPQFLGLPPASHLSAGVLGVWRPLLGIQHLHGFLEFELGFSHCVANEPSPQPSCLSFQRTNSVSELIFCLVLLVSL